jgi:hypothetical protein
MQCYQHGSCAKSSTVISALQVRHLMNIVEYQEKGKNEEKCKNRADISYAS